MYQLYWPTPLSGRPDLREATRAVRHSRVHAIAVGLGWIVASLAIVFGLVWRAKQYGAQFSFTTDELALARNVTERSVLAIIEHLEFAQVAPIGFLLVLKACAWLFGPSEWSLRLVPFVAGLGVIPLCWVVSRRALASTGAAAAATALVALATPVALWSTILKQYVVDIVAVLAVLAMAQGMLERSLSRRDIRRAAAIGAGAALFSHAIVFAIAACGVVLVGEALHRRHYAELRARALVVGIWSTAAGALLLWGVWHALPADRLYMRQFWNPNFIPWDPRAAVAWLWDRLLGLFLGGPWPNAELMYSRPKLWMLVLACGAITLLKRRPWHAALLLLPAIFTLAASAVRQYPFGGRTSLFLIPLVMMLISEGAERLAAAAGKRVAAIAPLLLISFAALPMAKFPASYHPEHMRPNLEYLSAQLQPADTVWVYYGAAQSFLYYAPALAKRAEVIFGTCDRTDPRANLRQIDAARGRHRVWVVLTHIPRAERRPLLEYLDTIGTRLETYSRDPRPESTTASTLFLYDLADPARLSQASSADFAVPPVEDPSPWSCYGPMSALPGSEHAAAAALARMPH